MEDLDFVDGYAVAFDFKYVTVQELRIARLVPSLNGLSAAGVGSPEGLFDVGLDGVFCGPGEFGFGSCSGDDRGELPTRALRAPKYR